MNDTAIQIRTLYDVWYYLNNIKVEAVKILKTEDWITVKQECDDLFNQASNGRYKIFLLGTLRHYNLTNTE